MGWIEESYTIFPINFAEILRVLAGCFAVLPLMIFNMFIPAEQSYFLSTDSAFHFRLTRLSRISRTSASAMPTRFAMSATLWLRACKLETRMRIFASCECRQPANGGCVRLFRSVAMALPLCLRMTCLRCRPYLCASPRMEDHFLPGSMRRSFSGGASYHHSPRISSSVMVQRDHLTAFIFSISYFHVNNNFFFPSDHSR
jgi:hypothetical protein